MKATVQSLWIGNALSELEILSINSFLKNSHDFHLYVYDDIKNVPEWKGSAKVVLVDIM